MAGSAGGVDADGGLADRRSHPTEVVGPSDVLGLVPDLASMGVPAAARVGRPDPAAASPYAVEEAAVARAVPARRAEFLTARALARAALSDLGVAPTGIAARADRAPAWPPGIVGAITHTRGLCAVVVAAVAGGGSGIGVGIDAERDVVLDDAVIDRVLTSGEQDSLGARRRADAVVVFSAKEALFKALHPATGVWLEPIDVELVLRGEPTSGVVTVRSWAGALPGVRPADVVGRWARFGPWVVTGFVLAPPGARR